MVIMRCSAKVIHADLSYKLNGIIFEVHKYLGRYCNEQQYSDAIEKLLKDCMIAYEREWVLPVSFTGEKSGRNKVDLLIDGKIVVEVKAKRFLTSEDYYQTKRYLQAGKFKLGLLVNFRDKIIRPKRILNSFVQVS